MIKVLIIKFKKDDYKSKNRISKMLKPIVFNEFYDLCKKHFKDDFEVEIKSL